MTNIIIAIDGFSSTGKSTLAKALANELSLIYVDTGAMYRAVTLYAMRHNLIDETHFDKNGLLCALPKIDVVFKYNSVLNKGEVYLNGQNVEHKIRTIEVSQYVSVIAALSEVRKKLVEQQKRMGAEGGLVMDGRDIGTVVFPEAQIKFFMTASAQVRAERRYRELKSRGDDITFEQVYENVVKRDYLDSTRIDSPLIKAKDAIEIDNSNLSIVEQRDMIFDIIRNKMK